MIPVPVRRSGTELLDQPSEQEDDAEFESGMADIRAVNLWLGGRRSIISHLPPFVGKQACISVLDISTGTADIPAAIALWAEKKGQRSFVAAADINPKILSYASRFLNDVPSVKLVAGDAFRLPFRDKSFDVVVCSLTLHHFTEAEVVEVIRKAQSLARKGIIIGDLRRSWISFFLFRAIAWLFLRNRFTMHDGPLSIMKSFTPDELKIMAERAGLKQFKIYSHVFWRMTLVATV